MAEKNYNIKRYDLSEDKSLRAWSAADEYLLQQFGALKVKPSSLGIYHDRFGFLGCHLNESSPTIILTHKSQETAIYANFSANKILFPKFASPIASLDNEIDYALLKIPKSLGLFRLFLEQISHNSTDNVTVICAFMTRHFTPKLVQIAEEYFEVVEQSRALKKARLLTLSKKKKVEKSELLTTLNYNAQEYKQYLGVFSADHIDYATQFFLQQLEVKATDQNILDLGSGNGIIGNEIHKQNPDAEIHLIDDAFLAVESAKLNIQGDNIHHYFDCDLARFDDKIFDLIVTNPPFHFEYEINIQVPIELFKSCHRCLKEGGTLQLVASKHLNYKLHLEKIFSTVVVVADEKKFVVYRCTK